MRKISIIVTFLLLLLSPLSPSLSSSCPFSTSFLLSPSLSLSVPLRVKAFLNLFSLFQIFFHPHNVNYFCFWEIDYFLSLLSSSRHQNFRRRTDLRGDVQEISIRPQNIFFEVNFCPTLFKIPCVLFSTMNWRREY